MSGRAAVVSIKDRISARRDAARARIRPETLQSLDRQALLALQENVGFGSEWGVPTIPLDWVQPGHQQALGQRRIDFRTWLPASISGTDLELARLALTRMSLLHWLVPRMAGRSLLPSVSTWRKHQRCNVLLAGRALARPGEGLFARLTARDFEAVWGDRAEAAAQGWTEYGERGLWSDLPRLGEACSLTVEPDRLGEPEGENSLSGGRPFTPYPDSFTAELGWRVAWIVEVAGPLLLRRAEDVFDVMEVPSSSAEPLTRKGLARKLGYERNKRFHTFDWQSAPVMPFQLHMKAKSGEAVSWPPKNFGELKIWLSVLQKAHLVVLLLSMGSRAGETHSLRQDALVEGAELDRVTGRTYKLVFAEEGELRDWPVPAVGAQAVRQQAALAALIKREGRRLAPQLPQGDNLWVRLGHGEEDTTLGDELRTPASALVKSLVEHLGLEQGLVGDERIHAHRFRKTLARLVALAIVGAPKILMDLFGHKSIEMTLSYILSDPALRAEVEEVAKAQTIMFAERAIDHAEANGGPAAPVLQQAVTAAKAQQGKDTFGVADRRELAEVLTLGGRSFQLVREGVLCIKQPHQAGACNKKVGKPEPSRCRGRCDFRLEDAFLRDDVDRALAQAVHDYEEAQANDEPVQAELWAGQVLANLPRFEDLRQRWSAHPTVAAILQAQPVTSL